MARWVERAAIAAAVLALLAGGVLLFAFREARADPVVRRATVALPGWPAGVPPMTIALASDIHLGSAAMDERRLSRIGDQVTALRPDLIALAGDFVAGHEPGSARRIATALATGSRHFRAPLGTVAVLGNHDHWTGAAVVRRALQAGGVIVLANASVRRGAVSLVGVDDVYSGHADPRRSLGANHHVPEIVLTHSPDLVHSLPTARAPLLLAGHTHCGQVVLPWLGPVTDQNPRTGRQLYDPRYRCGVVVDPVRTVIVTAGLGASLALRFGAPPDIWLVRVGPVAPG